MKLNKVSEDNRRTIHAVEGLFEDYSEFTFIHLKQGKAIGGCLHSKKEHYMIIKGKVYVKSTTLDGHDKDRMKIPANGGVFDSNEAHVFMAVEDSIICEWGISAEEKKSDEKDPNLLKFVNAVNNNV